LGSPEAATRLQLTRSPTPKRTGICRAEITSRSSANRTAPAPSPVRFRPEYGRECGTSCGIHQIAGFTTTGWLRGQSRANPSPPKNFPGPRLLQKRGVQNTKQPHTSSRSAERAAAPQSRRPPGSAADFNQTSYLRRAKIQLDFGRFRQPGPPGKGPPMHGLRELGTTHLQDPGSSGIFPVKRAVEPRSLTNF